MASAEAERLVAAGTAMCRKIGIDMDVVSFRMGPEHTEALHNILDAVRGNPIAESFLDWLLSLAAKDFDEACGENKYEELRALFVRRGDFCGNLMDQVAAAVRALDFYKLYVSPTNDMAALALEQIDKLKQDWQDRD